jgi:polyhydroxyalkanoate synthesis repressor PhaR
VAPRSPKPPTPKPVGRAAARSSATNRPSARPLASEPKRRRGRPARAETEEIDAAYPGERVIRRYANRRFYDRAQSRAVTLDEIAAMARANENIRILDVEREDQDITRRVLVQLILEDRNHDRLEMLPVDLLRKILALRDESLMTWLAQYLAAGANFIERQLHTAPPAAKAMTESFEAMLGTFLREAPEGIVPAMHPTEVQLELRDLRRRVEEMSGKGKRG